ncbi:DUF1259 domain-containing protein [Paenibacillus sp. sgz5001063]|uniref:DUF1259 domain-containing protein n=1 Tax=Paenibacillus sp. sgz5001063 TaxID=3242474 RepID=UPI0036D22CF2
MSVGPQCKRFAGIFGGEAQVVNGVCAATKLRTNIKVTALHYHWLFTNPNIWYIHWEAIQRPLVFAKNVREVSRVLTDKSVGPFVCKPAKK